MAGDYGDPDLATAIAHTHKNIPLVTFGHMHHRLRSNGKIRTALVQVSQTIYFNAASVPRIFFEQGKAIHHFAIAELKQGQVTQASLVWIDQDLQIWQELCLL
ncbi:MAG: TIGR04168 family protein, partial [Pseudanabaenaceae cyanobacterium bins.68]|nr:TIGR04168 family protein [Pseudanabaenaceae cyanobacterium bins.68]